MAEWKTQIGYNYNPSYRAYAYGLVYQPGPEQTHGNLSGTREESPPGSPEQRVVNGHCHYQGSGVVYLTDTQKGRLILAGTHPAAYDTRTDEPRRAGSDSTSDSEAHVSPDSWSFGSSKEVLPDPSTWTKKELDEETNSRSPDHSEDVSSSLVGEPQPFTDAGNKDTSCLSVHTPLPAPKKQSTEDNPKGKVRAAFSESQMNALVQRFSVQRYLTPAEMKNLGELTGLTYKQVKTWFQNRRMKLRRHQKDTNWVSERYTTKSSPVSGTILNNIRNHVPTPAPPSRTRVLDHKDGASRSLNGVIVNNVSQ
ncbi:unnamed protein product [Lampetra planeri]